MTLSLLAIGVVVTLLATFFFHGKKRGFFLFTFSVLAVYALQPALPIRFLDFALPTAALGLALLVWIIVSQSETRFSRANLFSLVWMVFLIVMLGLTRYIPFDPILTASTPPNITAILLSFAIFSGVALFVKNIHQKITNTLITTVLIGLLIILKTPQFSLWAAQLLRGFNQQAIESASAFDIRWIGFSYIVFRLVHTLQDSLKGRTVATSLEEFITFIFFYPALIAGPVDRLGRFVEDLRSPFTPKNEDWNFILRNLTLGLLKKFILADSLALLALNPQNAAQIQNMGWAWVFLYAYSFLIYLDFSGYTDLALALGCLAGVYLPENFNRPYLKPNITHFWNNWHMSLTQWFRAYIFNPLTRSLRGTPMPVWGIILLTQIITMSLIGLWHGITLNFLIWGLWHGFGLFLHNRWQTAMRIKVESWANTPARRVIIQCSGTLLTFHFVTLGWVWFVLPNPAAALNFFQLLMMGK
jgi:D-alanyl-lipoteichoic acid acyltransferase DltB (MBOAT superfamily)